MPFLVGGFGAGVVSRLVMRWSVAGMVGLGRAGRGAALPYFSL
jgi:hypothetical protein